MPYVYSPDLSLKCFDNITVTVVHLLKAGIQIYIFTWVG